MVYVVLPPHLGYSRMSRQRSRNASATCPRLPRERPVTAVDNEASLGRVWDHRKLLERGFLLCTASIYHCDNTLPDEDMSCARILRARTLLRTLWARPGLTRSGCRARGRVSVPRECMTSHARPWGSHACRPSRGIMGRR